MDPMETGKETPFLSSLKDLRSLNQRIHTTPNRTARDEPLR